MMDYKLLEKQDLKSMKDILEEDNINFNFNTLEKFLDNNNAYGFIAKENNKVFGFIYGYSLLRPDGRYMFYVHSVGVLSEYQGKKVGTNLFNYMIQYLKNEHNCDKLFLLTDKNNIIAQKLYKKYSTKECEQLYFEISLL